MTVVTFLIFILGWLCKASKQTFHLVGERHDCEKCFSFQKELGDLAKENRIVFFLEYAPGLVLQENRTTCYGRDQLYPEYMPYVHRLESFILRLYLDLNLFLKTLKDHLDAKENQPTMSELYANEKKYLSEQRKNPNFFDQLLEKSNTFLDAVKEKEDQTKINDILKAFNFHIKAKQSTRTELETNEKLLTKSNLLLNEATQKVAQTKEEYIAIKKKRTHEEYIDERYSWSKQILKYLEFKKESPLSKLKSQVEAFNLRNYTENITWEKEINWLYQVRNAIESIPKIQNQLAYKKHDAPFLGRAIDAMWERETTNVDHIGAGLKVRNAQWIQKLISRFQKNKVLPNVDIVIFMGAAHVEDFHKQLDESKICENEGCKIEDYFLYQPTASGIDTYQVKEAERLKIVLKNIKADSEVNDSMWLPAWATDKHSYKHQVEKQGWAWAKSELSSTRIQDILRKKYFPQQKSDSISTQEEKPEDTLQNHTEVSEQSVTAQSDCIIFNWYTTKNAPIYIKSDGSLYVDKECKPEHKYTDSYVYKSPKDYFGITGDDLVAEIEKVKKENFAEYN